MMPAEAMLPGISHLEERSLENLEKYHHFYFKA